MGPRESVKILNEAVGGELTDDRRKCIDRFVDEWPACINFRQPCPDLVNSIRSLLVYYNNTGTSDKELQAQWDEAAGAVSDWLDEREKNDG